MYISFIYSNSHFLLYFSQTLEFQQDPFVMREESEGGGPPKYKGYCIDLIEEIRKLVGFEYEIFVAPDNSFGNMDENGQWNGMIKELIEKVRQKYKDTSCRYIASKGKEQSEDL